MFKKILLVLVVVLVAGIAAVFFWLNGLKPEYTGEKNIAGLQAETKVFYDKYGVPHIYANSAEDAYCALGYVVAQDRLFQFELIRRLAAGRLGEILGKDLVQSDRFFRTIGLNRHAAWSADEFTKTASPEIKKAADAYIKGFNAYIENGHTPVEFTILGIDAEPMKLTDIFLVSGYMSFGFAEGFRIDPMVEEMHRKLGDKFMRYLNPQQVINGEKIPVTRSGDFKILAFAEAIEQIVFNMPVSPWIGSNAWVLAPRKSKSGKTLLCNDTHMGFTQPAVWYEAHLEYPGFSLYGNHLAGFPFALTAHTNVCANGLTMFENDDVDFYIEKIDGKQVTYQNEQVSLKEYAEIIHVKGGSDINLQVRETPHGPLINDALETLMASREQVSVWWTYLKFPAKSLEAVYGLNHAGGIDDARNAASLIHAPGLNVMYGDSAGHIAWWAAGRLYERPSHVNPLRFLDGASGKDDPLRWLDFSENPYSEDPASGYVYSANNQPDSISIGYYPGYYVPENRAEKIVQVLGSKEKLGPDDVKKLMLDNTSSKDADLAKSLLSTLGAIAPNSVKTEEANRLSAWDGVYGMESSGALIFNHWIYNIL
ncbi:MAG: penicillin acylase family protein, partial [Bacteroidetes bacterium]|nr:penicillin acylase family protein [Bacteroidota bacterium]